MKISVMILFAVLWLVLAPPRVMADAQQDQSACMMDAQTFCG